MAAGQELAPLARELETALKQVARERAPILDVLQQDLRYLIPRPATKARVKVGRTESESIANWKKDKAAAAARVRRKADKIKQEAEKLQKQVASQPKYNNPVFTCINDLDKCRANRGPYSTLCALAFLLCMAKHSKALFVAAGAAIAIF